MRTNNLNRRWAGAVGMAVSAASVLIGLANAPAATADTDVDPFQDLFGATGINTWTPSADSFLANVDPTGALAGNFDTSVDNFLTPAGTWGPNDPFSMLAAQFDQTAFDPNPWFNPDSCLGGCDIIPADSTGDFALGLDYTVFASGLAPTLDPLIGGLDQVTQASQLLLGALVFDIALLLGPIIGI
jgi:hypothetical protein